MAGINPKAHKSVWNYKLSITFLVVIIIGTVALYLYNNFLWGQLEEIKKTISSYENSIKEIEQDKNLQIYSLLELNKKTIEKYKVMNDISGFINHMNSIGIKYGLKLYWFQLSSEKIETLIKSDSDAKTIAYKKIVDFISTYRADENAKFDLLFVDWVEWWMDEIKFKVNFKIK